MSDTNSKEENALQSSIPQFSHDPNFIEFRSWTTILSLKGTLPDENPFDSNILFLDETDNGCEMEELLVRSPVCFRNSSRFTHLNVTIVNSQSGNHIFFMRELPSGRFVHLKFLQEGSYTLHYSPAFTPVTLHRQIKTVGRTPRPSFAPCNFHHRFKPTW